MFDKLDETLQKKLSQDAVLEGVGCDLVSIDRIEKLIEKHGEKFPQRILSSSEIEIYNQKKDQHKVEYLAKRWAGKEAVVKAAGSGFVSGTSWREISILNDENGKPLVMIEGNTAKTLEFESKQRQYFISLSDDAGMALAFCVVVRIL